MAYSIRDLVPHSDLSERPMERDLRLHHVAQAQLSRKYRTFKPEVTLSATVRVNGTEIALRGRIDGYRRTPKGIFLYEIKSVPGEPRAWLRSPLLQNARWQLQMYAELASLAAEKPWGDSPVIGGVLCLVGSGHKLALESVDCHSELELLDKRLRVLLSASRPWRENRERNLALLDSFAAGDVVGDRPAQQEAVAALQTEPVKRRVLLAMPPGSGKTRVALRFALREAFRQNLRLYWITAKARGRDEVISELARYRAAGIPLRVVWKTTAERICDCSAPGYGCPRRLETRAALFLDSLADFREKPSWNAADVNDYAQEHSFCPHELSGAVEKEADVVIADMNYILNPSRLFAHEAVMVLDEAQNMAQRVYDNSRIRIRRDELLALMHAVSPSVRRAIRDVLNTRTGDDESLLLREALQALREQTSRLSRLPALPAIRRAARLLADLGEDFRVAWSRGGPEPEIIGTAVDARSTMQNALAPHPLVLALSGSLPADDLSREALFPVCDEFEVLEIGKSRRPPVAIVPELAFKYPLTAEDHSKAVNFLIELRRAFSPVIAVFGQNRASNEILAMSLRVRGYVILLDEDLEGDWSTAVAAQPDFLFIAIGGTLSESVNPPPELLTAAAVLSPAYRAPDAFAVLRGASRGEYESPDEEDVGDANWTERKAEAVSRIIQAAGRLQRSPEFVKPVFLLNQDFARPDYLHAWPRNWYVKSPHEMVYPSLNSALESLRLLDAKI